MRRLTQKKFLIAENFSSWPDLHLPDGINLRDIAMTPASSHRCPRQVVAIDCEMVAVGSGRFEGGKEKERNELAQLCAVDVLTGVVLIDKLVLPREKVLNWNTRYSGVSYPKICAARESGRLLRGWQAARAELLSFIDVNTIIVGHAVENDLHILRIAHSKIVDTSIQTAEAVYGDTERLGRTWGLKELAKSLPGLFVQVEKKKGHDCVEDTLATREIALWCLNHHPELAEWATRMRVELENKRVEREKKKEEDRKKTEAQNEVPAGQGWPQIPLPPLGFELSQGTSDNLNQLDASY
ncbi:hypothetical protein BKA67DRAFT_314352 [Truncatella angustata]|uniref:Exonuclease domain-containing protein n=1 Tax=Truncatella angustata TaxID=152316 RepID=A0A9P8UJG1_9PEZI|nr:uncharacterized protein BKA67DRAFT_314352 [Truncatella angustata]KAH6653350.1 hypothetical protein BKA67DRAFT_314352 [Truncatella angustata]